MVLTLALANVGYFLWVGGIQPSAAVPSAALPTTLKLVSEVPQAAVESHCMSVGPFRDVAEAARAASSLRASGYDPRQRVLDGQLYNGIWVYLPVNSTHAVTEQTIAKLRAAGIEDALEMPGPVDGSVISLGLFGEQKRAQARVTQVQALGMNPTLTDRRRSGNVYWIDVDLKAGDEPFKPADRMEVTACPVAAAAAP